MQDFNPEQSLSDLREIMGGMKQTLVLADGKVVEASVSTGQESDGLEIAGVTDERRLTAYFAVVDCKTLPVEADIISYRQQNYKIKNRFISDDGVTINITATGEFE